MKAYQACGAFALAALVWTTATPAATLTVTTPVDAVTDDAACSLREAVLNANANNDSAEDACGAGESAPAVDEIVFDPSLAGTNIELSIAGTGENAAATGDLDITDDLTIQGLGGFTFDDTGFRVDDADTVIDGRAIDRVFQVDSASLTLRDLAVTGGASPDLGGAVWVSSSASLSLIDAAVGLNEANRDGGGIGATGTVSLTRSWVQRNRAGIAATSDVAGGGIYMVGASADLEITDSVIIGNLVESDQSVYGGGIYSSTSATDADQLTITGSIIAGNGAISTAADNARGGGLYAVGNGRVGIRRSLVAENSATSVDGLADGGGLYLAESADLVNLTVDTNVAESTSAIAGGGGISVNSAAIDVAVRNSTITFNESSGDGSNAGGLAVIGGTGSVADTVLAANVSTGTGSDVMDCSGALTSMGYNLISDDRGCASLAPTTGDQVGSGAAPLDPRLGSLADNGGGFTVDGHRVPLLSRLPADDSPLVDAGDPNAPGSGGTCATTDQRGEPRPQDGDDDGAAVCDIGAVELAEAPPPSSGGGGGSTGLPALLALAGLVLAVRRRATGR